MVNIIMGQMLLHVRVSSKQSSYVITNGLVTLNVEQAVFLFAIKCQHTALRFITSSKKMGIRNDVDILNLNLAQLCFNHHTLSKQRGQNTVHRISKQSLNKL